MEWTVEYVPEIKWEYKILKRPTAKDLTTLGELGWELVSVWGDGVPTEAYLKRPKRSKT